VLLFHPKSSSSLYPYPVQHSHDRQSQINDIQNPDISKYPLCERVLGWQGVLKAGEVLYIPYGWWHEIESTGNSVSVSYRWNPYEPVLRQVAAITSASREEDALPKRAVALIVDNLLRSAPAVVSFMYRFRHPVAT